MNARLILALALSTAVVPMLYAQDLPQDIASGIQQYQSYHGGTIDQVSLASGNLHAKIPLISYPQRGGKLKLDFALEFNGKPESIQQTCIPNLPDPPDCELYWTPARGFAYSGWRIVDEQTIAQTDHFIGWTQDNVGYGYYETVWVTPDGATHPGASVTSVSGESGQISLDGSGYFNGANDSGTCTSQCYTTDSQGISYNPTSSILREDSNGNYIAANSDGSLTDTMGRVIPPWPGPPGPNSNSSAGCTGPLPIVAVTTWQPPGFNGDTLTYKFCYAEIALNIPDTGIANGGETGTPIKLQSVILPNGQTWTFEYNSQNPGDPAPPEGQTWNYGDLTKITLPTGGIISYTYNLKPSSTTISMWAASRTVKTSASDPGGTWQYLLDAWSNSGSTMRVRDPNSNDTVHTFLNYGFTTRPSFMETATKWYSGSYTSGTVLRSSATTYSTVGLYGGTPDQTAGEVIAFPTKVVTTLDNGKVTETDTAYCCSFTASWADASSTSMTYGRPSDVKVYDYGSGAHGSLLQEKKTTYEFQSNSSFAVANLLDAVATEDVYDGSGNHLSDTAYSYDESTYLTSSGFGTSVQLDTTPLSSVRGNVTSTTHWLSGGTSPVTHTNWYNTGEPYKLIDALSNTAATYAYSSEVYWGGFPISVTNAKSQKTQYGYDANGLGLKTSVIDPNTQTTTYNYDSTGRPLSVVYPDTCPSNSSIHGETDYSYTDTVPVSFKVSEVSCSGSPNVEQVDIDGLARQTRTEEQSDPSGTVYTDTTYDTMGRKWKESNPYRTTSDKTYGLTTTAYDALSRPISVTHPDTTVATSSYTGSAVNSTDEGNGTKTLSTVTQKDALGRVITVCEVTSATQQGVSGDTTPAACNQDISATGFLTSYAYDGMGNLKSVVQGSLTHRNFTYDTLQRLLTAANPESGTTTYTYDANSNLITRARRAPNQPVAGTVNATATYTYDTLNRITDTTYADTYNTGSPTPAEHFDYDVTTGAVFTITSAQHLVGRLVDAYTKTGTTYVAGRAFSYDPAGRPLNTAECTIDDCAAAWYYNLTYTYDVNSNPLGFHFLTAGATDFTLTPGYDTKAQLTTLTSSWSDSTHPAALFSSALYGPLGGMTSATLGSGETESFAYDQRDRLACGTVLKGSSTVYSVALNNANGQCSAYTGSGYSGNGNVTASHDSVNGNWTYQYDDFNRLSAASASSGPYSGTSMTWTYDHYGNRWTQTKNGTGQSFTFSGGNNRVSGFTYDAAGNLLNDGVNSYKYDDENRIATVTLASGGSATYNYDAEGQRIRKAIGATVDEYVYDPAGHQIGDMQPNGAMKSIELYVGARHLATYDIASNNTYFAHGDWLGSERVRTTSAGLSYETCINQPFGDGQTCTGATDVSPMHFTGKPRDTETTLDYFGARFYSSAMSRWMSPDWADKPTSVPYANFGDPQSLNLYGYVGNNPVSKQDSDGHWVSGAIYHQFADSGPQNFLSQMLAASGDEAHNILIAALQSNDQGQGEKNPDAPAQPSGQPTDSPFMHYFTPPKQGQPGGRQLDPNGDECIALAKKIGYIATDIIKRDDEITRNPSGLPEIGGTGSSQRASVQGHRDKMSEEIDNLGAAADRYNNMCGGGPPPLSPVGGFSPDSSSSSSSRQGTVAALGYGLIVLGAVALAPETGGLSLAFAF
jgi:RHS repeat-associated protein